MISWLLLAALWISAVVIFRRHRYLCTEDAWTAAGVCTFAELCLLIWAAGAFGALRPSVVRGGSIALLLLHLGLALLTQTDADPPRVDFRWRPRWPVVLWPALAGVLIVVLFRVFLAWKIPPESWDGLSYHLPLLWRWLQQGNFDLAGLTGPSRYFPWNGELLPAWLCLIDGGGLGPAKVAQTAALPLWVCAAGSLGRRLGGARWSGACMVAAAAVPIAVLHLGVPYVDLLYAAFWIAAAAAAAAYDREGRNVHLLLFSLAFGLSMGTKSTLYFQAPLLVPVAWTLWARPELRRPALRMLPLLFLAATACGGITYLRNWVQMGNPIYPFTLKLAGVRVFDGITEPGELLVTVERWFVPSKSAWLWYPFFETRSGTVGYSLENGFGPLFAAGWGLLPLTAWVCGRRRDRAALSFLALLPATVLFFFLMHPTREPRYVIFLSVIPIVGLAALLRRVRGGWRCAALCAWTAGVLWCALGVLAFCGRDAGTNKAWAGIRRTGAVPAGDYYVWQYGPLGEGWRALDARVKEGETVATNYGELHLPWAGTPPRARVRVVGHKSDDYPQTLFAETDEDWLALLDGIEARYLGLWMPKWYPDVGQAEAAAVARFPERFRKLGEWSDGVLGRVFLFEILPAKAAVPTPS